MYELLEKDNKFGSLKKKKIKNTILQWLKKATMDRTAM